MNPKEQESYTRLNEQLSSIKEDECPCRSCGEACKKSSERWIDGLQYDERCESCFDAIEKKRLRSVYDRRQKGNETTYNRMQDEKDRIWNVLQDLIKEESKRKAYSSNNDSLYRYLVTAFCIGIGVCLFIKFILVQ